MNNSTNKLSITIATYNVEDYIRESMESILNQTFRDFELICIDDGSRDNTVAVLREYASKDNRIKVVEKKINEGLAVARNESLALAKGRYVTFLDGDDIYDLSMFEKAVNCAEKNKSDIVMWDYLTFFNTDEIPVHQKKRSELLDISANDKIKLLQRPAFTGGKLLKTDVVKQIGIYFPIGLTRQDIPVHWHLITKLDKISIIPERFCFYRQQPEATTAKKDEKLFHLAFVTDVVKKYLQENNFYEQYKDEFLRQQLNLLFGMYDNIQNNFKEQAKRIIEERISDEHYKYINDGNPLRKPAVFFYLSLRGNFFAKIKLSVWNNSRLIFRKIKSLC